MCIRDRLFEAVFKDTADTADELPKEHDQFLLGLLKYNVPTNDSTPFLLRDVKNGAQKLKLFRQDLTESKAFKLAQMPAPKAKAMPATTAAKKKAKRKQAKAKASAGSAPPPPASCLLFDMVSTVSWTMQKVKPEEVKQDK
eukprot:10036653-Alexandrium_andersonii.AAC.1